MKKETFWGVVAVTGIWLVSNWFRIVTVILLIIICNKLGTISGYMDDIDFQVGGIRIMDSDIRDHTSNIETNTKSQYQYNAYPSVIHY